MSAFQGLRCMRPEALKQFPTLQQMTRSSRVSVRRVTYTKYGATSIPLALQTLVNRW